MIVLATATWNCIDLVSTFLSHYTKLGIDGILAMDFDSTDGTREVLTSAEWQHFVRLVPFPGIAGLDSSNRLLSLAQGDYGSDSWCLFCDPDELLVTPTMSIRDAAIEEMRRAEWVSIPRFNVTAPLSLAIASPSRLSALDGLTLRIDGRHQRNVGADIEKDTLDPPWIVTAIPGKVFVRVEAARRIGDGDHTAETRSSRMSTAPAGTHLLQYPFRSYSQFAHKIELASIDFDSNPDLPAGYGWQLTRWRRLANAGKLYEEYLQQFIRDEDTERLLGNGTLALDESIVRFHRP
jgi:hypothetical protein